MSEDSMKAIYKYYVNCGRMGSLEGLFVEEKEDIAKRIDCLIHFGECLGKHSNVNLPFEERHLTIVSEDARDIEVLERLGITSVGTNPMEHHYVDKETGEEVEV
jgi:hypothetical protein